MPEKWYWLVLGAELGPMSWDDLVRTMANGALRPHDQVRCESEGWRAASTVDGLLTAAAVLRLAERSLAEDPPAGFVGSGENSQPEDDTGFDVDVALLQTGAESDTDFDVSAATPTAAASTEDEFASDLSAYTGGAAMRSNPADAEVSGPRDATTPLASTLSQAAPAHPALRAGTTVPKWPENKKPEKNKPPKRAPRERTSFEITAAHKKALVGMVGACCLAGLGYLAYGALGSRSSANYDTILADYQKLYDEAQSAHQNRAAGTMPDVQKRFVDTLANVRKPLEGAEPGTMDDRLYQAGSYLVEMLADASAPPQSRGEVKYINAEKSYNDLVTSVRGELGK